MCTRTVLDIGVILALGLALVGCERGANEPGGVSSEGLREEPRGAFDAAYASPALERRSLESRAQQVLQDADLAIENARRAVGHASAEERAPLEAALDRAQGAREALSAEIEGLEHAGAEEWAATRQRVSDAMLEMAEARRRVAAALPEGRATG